MISKKFLNRWAGIFLQKLNKDGKEAANEWASRTFSDEILQQLIPIIQAKRQGK